MGNVRTDYPAFATTGLVPTDNTALVVGGIGYKFHDGLSLAFEAGYDDHNLKNIGTFTPGGATPETGHVQIRSALVNVAYDFPLSDRWDFTIGAGAGVGNAFVNQVAPPGNTDINANHLGYMYQGFAGFGYALTRNVDLTLDWRYRSLSENKEFGPFAAHVGKLSDEAVMIGVKWYPFAAPPPAPPPPPPPPLPPPPPPPPPTRTFIVFFDFNKSNLTAEAQAVVTEAVKSAKANGIVRVLVTGHTDTVGSDSYNQGLSVRRAESVKDEMQREGMDGSSISIEGKSFHDPLVPTGPGVREPQNRRAVIDLGS
jgi:outer membrane protein OmpA-like peptidoglycan-associated protein